MDLQAYNSKKSALGILSYIVICVVLIPFSLMHITKLTIVLLVLVVPTLLWFIIDLVYHLTLPNLAFEIGHGQITLYKRKTKKSYELQKISSIRIYNNKFHGSEMWIDGKCIKLHYHIQNEKEVLEKFDEIIKDYKIRIIYRTEKDAFGD